MTNETEQKQADLATAPDGGGGRAISSYRVVFHVAIEGVPVDVERDGVLGGELSGFIKRTVEQFKKNGFVGAELAPDIDIALPPAASNGGSGGGSGQSSSGEAVKILGEGGAPPKCSLHGVMKWVEGDKDGRHYAFWGCTVRGCRPKEPK